MRLIIELDLPTPLCMTPCELIAEVTQDLENAIHSESELNPDSILVGARVLEVHREN